MKRRWRATWLVTAGVALQAACCASSLGATAELRHRKDEGQYGDVDRFYAGVTYTAGSHEANDLTATESEATVSFVDRNATITAGPGCESLGRHEVRCMRRSYESFSPVIRVGDRGDAVRVADMYWDVHGGGGSDTLAVERRAGPIDGAAGFHGGAGDDVLAGGDGEDYLYGGAGADRLDGREEDDLLVGDARDVDRSADEMDGGAGVDTVSYTDRLGGVVIDLEGGGSSGAAGEGDALRSVENAAGGRGSDRILGNAADNVLVGDGDGDLGGYTTERGAGGSAAERDTIAGRDGDDTLDGTPGADRLLGGPGDDALDGWGGADRVFGGRGDDYVDPDEDGAGAEIGCGPGDDAVSFSYPDVRLRQDCERVQVADLFLHPPLVRWGSSSLALDLTFFADPYDPPPCKLVVKLSGPFGAPGPPPRFLGRGETRVVLGHRRRMKIALTGVGRRTLLRGSRRTVPVRLRLFGRQRCDGDQPLSGYGTGFGNDLVVLVRAPVRR